MKVYLCHCDDPSKTAFHSCDTPDEAFDWYVDSYLAHDSDFIPQWVNIYERVCKVVFDH